MVDVSIKVPALEKLVDYTASGIGAVAGPMVATWKANKEAEAKRITAQADADAQITKAKADADTLQIIADAQSKARSLLMHRLNQDMARWKFARVLLLSA